MTTATPAQYAAAINRLETARRILGHAALVPAEAVDLAFGPDSPVRAGLIRYAMLLVEAQEEMTDEENRLPVPVIPAVDITNLRVSHQTCTGRTGIGVADGNASMTRAVPLDADSPRDIALWLLLDANMASDRLFEHANVFGQDTSRRRGGPAVADGTVLEQLRVLEGIAVLVEHGVTVEAACAMASRRGIPADPTRVREEIESRRVGLWLANRPWLQDAHRVMVGASPECRYSNADLPEWARQSAAAMRQATNSGRRSGGLLTAPARPAEEPLAEWERELANDAS